MSLLELNPRNRQVQAELRDPYQMHRTISKAFGDSEDIYKSARCLFRVDELDGSKLCALIQSKVQPEWDRWEAPKGYLVKTPQVKAFTPSLAIGQCLAFKLRANPSVKRDGKRIGVYDETERLEWLNRKAKNGGFILMEARVASDVKQKSATKEGRELAFSAAIFTGVLKITDTDMFFSTLENGIGSAKGFGFGLLSIAPLGR